MARTTRPDPAAPVSPDPARSAPGSPLDVSRRDFLRLGSTAAALAAAPPALAAGALRRIEVAPGARGVEPFRFAFLSDTHLRARGPAHRTARAVAAAVDEINALDPRPDFVVFGGDLAQDGLPEELALGRQLLARLEMPVRMVVGEHDWFRDLGAGWRETFGPDHYAFEHRGAHFVVLNSIRQDDFWSAARLDPARRHAVATGHDDVRRRPFRVGADQRAWLEGTLGALPSDATVFVLSHVPLHPLHAEWGFGVEDADEVARLLGRFERVTALHGHVHRALDHERGRVRHLGMLSTARPLPAPPGARPPALPGGATAAPAGDVVGIGVLDVAPGAALARSDRPRPWEPWRPWGPGAFAAG